MLKAFNKVFQSFGFRMLEKGELVKMKLYILEIVMKPILKVLDGLILLVYMFLIPNNY